jgi:hypothetical protein
VFIFSVILFGGASTVSAVASNGESSPAQTRAENRQEMQAIRQENQEERRNLRQENKEERQEMRQERREERAQKHSERLQKRFDFYAERLGRIMDKLQTRLMIMKNDGKDITSAEAKLDDAKDTLEEAKTLGDQSVAAFSAIDPEKYEEQRSKVLAARDLAMAAREKFKLANTEIKEAVALAKSVK